MKGNETDRDRSYGKRFRRTLSADLIRAVAGGVLETCFVTFAILIANGQFASGPTTKSLLLASPAFGLIGSLFVTSVTARLRLSVSRAASLVALLSAAGYTAAAIAPRSEIFFVGGLCFGMGFLGLVLPLQTQYVRENYPDKNRGRSFSLTLFVKAGATMIASWFFGGMLDKDFSTYEFLLWIYVAMSLLTAVCYFVVPSRRPREDADAHNDLSQALEEVRQDRVFCRILVSSMALGLGVMAVNALKVDYVDLPEYGVELDVQTISLITGIIPSVVRLSCTFFWGWLFDRIDFFRLRFAANFVFLLGVLLYFVWPNVALIAVGSGLLGMARAGGEILFSLCVTKLAPQRAIADYMSVHTFLAGLRILSAPFLAFYLVSWFGLPVILALSSALIILSLMTLLPLVRNPPERMLS